MEFRVESSTRVVNLNNSLIRVLEISISRPLIKLLKARKISYGDERQVAIENLKQCCEIEPMSSNFPNDYSIKK